MEKSKQGFITEPEAIVKVSMRQGIAAVALAGAAAIACAASHGHPGPGPHEHHHFHGHRHFHGGFGVFIGGPLWWGPWPPVYPPVYFRQEPPVFIEDGLSFWYYCPNPRGYFPYVNNCSAPWQRIPSDLDPPDDGVIGEPW